MKLANLLIIGQRNELGRKDGEWIYYRNDENKSIIKKAIFDDGFVNGYVKYFDSKNRLREIIFVNDKIDHGWNTGEGILIDYESI